MTNLSDETFGILLALQASLVALASAAEIEPRSLVWYLEAESTRLQQIGRDAGYDTTQMGLALATLVEIVRSPQCSSEELLKRQLPLRMKVRPISG